MRRRLESSFRFVVLAMFACSSAAACVAASDDGARDQPRGPQGELDAAASDATGNVDVTTPPSNLDAAALDVNAADVLDAGSADSDDGAIGPVDPFVPRWRAPADIPAGSSYQTDKDAGVVTDKTTGLIWARSLLSAKDLPPDGGDGSPQTQAEARAQCASATIGGTQGWRLPTRIEWLSLVRLDEEFVNDTSAFVEADWFGGIPFWVMTDDPTRSVIYDDHYHNHTFKPSRAGAGFYSASTRCVKTTYPVTPNAQPPSAGRYVVDAATVIDTVTHLVWARAFNASALFDFQAADYCTNLATSSDAGVDAGAKPWRLPTVKEFASLWNEASGLPPELDTQSSSQSYWTGTPYVKPSYIVTGYAKFRFTFTKPGAAGGDFAWDAQAVQSSARCVRSLD